MKKTILMTALKKAAKIAKEGLYPDAGKVLVEVKDNLLTLSARNNVMYLETTKELDGQAKEVKCTVQASMFVSVMNKFPAEDISLSIAKGNLVISSGKTKVNLPAGDTKAWVSHPTFEPTHRFKIDERILQCEHALAKPNVGNTLMRSYHLEADANNLRVTALDGFRISVFDSGLKNPEVDLVFENEMAKEALSLSEGEVTLATDGQEIMFLSEDVTIWGRVRTEKYFQINSILSSISKRTKVTLDWQEFRDLLIISSLFDKSTVLDIKQNEVGISNLSSVKGQTDGSLPAEVEGAVCRIGFNAQYMIDLLDSIKSDSDGKVTLYFSGNKKPCYAETEEQFELLLPIALQQ